MKLLGTTNLKDFTALMRFRRTISKLYRQTRLRPCLPALIVLLAVAPSELFKAPAEIHPEKGSVVVKDSSGKQRWTADWTVEPATNNGRRAVRFTENGKGRYSPFTTEVQWSLESVWSADGFYRPLRVDKTYRDSAGKVLATDKKLFQPAAMRWERSAAGKKEAKTFSASPDVIAVDGIGLVLRAFPFENREFSTHLISNEPRLYDVTFENRGRERVRVPAGEFDCYRIEAEAHLGVLSLVKPFLAKTTFWMTVEPPHFWVRYQGYENGRGTPEIVMELTSHERSSASLR